MGKPRRPPHATSSRRGPSSTSSSPGRSPSRARRCTRVLYQIISEEPEPVLTVNPELPARLAARGAPHAAQGRPTSATRRSRRPGASSGGCTRAPPLRRSLRAASRRVCPRWRTRPGRASATTSRAAEAHLEERTLREAAAEELQAALALDPDSDEAAEALWRDSASAADRPPGRAPAHPEAEARIAALLQRAKPGRPTRKRRRRSPSWPWSPPTTRASASSCASGPAATVDTGRPRGLRYAARGLEEVL